MDATTAHDSDPWLDRTSLLWGEGRMERLAASRVLVVGTGGVGAWAAEMICRAGVGSIVLIRFRDINPAVMVEARVQFIDGTMTGALLDEGYDFVVDAIDTVAPKCDLIAAALSRGTGIVSSMGAGAKSDPAQIRLADLWQTTNCGLAKAVRHGLKARGIRAKLPVVFSTEPADRHAIIDVNERNKRSTAGTVSYMPAIFGCYMASYVLKHL